MESRLDSSGLPSDKDSSGRSTGDRIVYDKSESIGYRDEVSYEKPAPKEGKKESAKYMKMESKAYGWSRSSSAGDGASSPAPTLSHDFSKGKKGESYKSVTEIADIPDAIGIKAGMLTAGEVNDFSKWNMWNDIAEGDLKTHTTVWQMQPKNRYTVQVSNKDNFPVVNATVKLFDKKGKYYLDGTYGPNWQSRIVGRII